MGLSASEHINCTLWGIKNNFQGPISTPPEFHLLCWPQYVSSTCSPKQQLSIRPVGARQRTTPWMVPPRAEAHEEESSGLGRSAHFCSRRLGPLWAQNPTPGLSCGPTLEHVLSYPASGFWPTSPIPETDSVPSNQRAGWTVWSLRSLLSQEVTGSWQASWLSALAGVCSRAGAQTI